MSDNRVSQSSCGQGWTTIIRPKSGWLDIDLSSIWKYRDLVFLFVWRDFVAVYKQTILGPLWYVIQPLLTTLVFTVVFSNVAHLPTDGVPPYVFYLSGVVVWRYFSDSLIKNADTFGDNSNIFGKVYFPRLTVPVSVVTSNLVSLGIQLLLLTFFLFYYGLGGDSLPSTLMRLLLVPILVVQMASLGLGFGIIISSLTTRYRDLSHLVSFGVQLWMYATPIVYPASMLPGGWRWLLILNPMAPVVEVFRYACFGVGHFPLGLWGVSLLLACGVLLGGIVIFSRVEKTFMDTV